MVVHRYSIRPYGRSRCRANPLVGRPQLEPANRAVAKRTGVSTPFSSPFLGAPSLPTERSNSACGKIRDLREEICRNEPRVVDIAVDLDQNGVAILLEDAEHSANFEDEALFVFDLG